MRFRLLKGSHTQTDGHGNLVVHRAPVRNDGKPENAARFPVIASDVDLCERFNRPESVKFERLPD